MFVNILPHESSCGQYLEYKKLDKYIFMIMFHTDDKSPTDDKSLTDDYFYLPQIPDLHRSFLRLIGYHRTFKRRANWSSPL